MHLVNYQEDTIFYGSPVVVKKGKRIDFLDGIKILSTRLYSTSWSKGHLPDHQDGTLIYGMSPSYGVQQGHPSTNVDAAFATSSNHYNPYVAAPCASMDFPVPVNQGVHDWLPFSGTHGIIGNSADNFGGAGGCVDARNMGVQGYQVTSRNGGLTSFLHPPILQGPPHHHHLPPNMQCTGGHTMSFSPQMTASSHTNNPFQGFIEGGSRYIGPLPPTGFRLYRPHQREFMLGTNTRHRDLPNMRFLPQDGMAMPDVVDQHRDMRLDIDRMSYEELLALEEQIGSVTTGLSEEAIVTKLKTRIFLSSKTPCARESVACQDHKTDFCVVCQIDYDDQEKIAILECGHEYHLECVKKWLVMKNTCPICKSTALSTEKKDL
ncbi:hypothetical protein K7X08_012269 [Anisodus acutangulus]|uniref:RING-type E3 ubiquitin transferase n=1 Tax=Anisodus acutangulus TaxID=402998 RepID=A0A9Q1LCU7_9SOLA|nr:hypothetical protein K7X08_012269 [Anisodus acutangulus]